MAKTYSGGMRRRLDLAASLVGRPSVIFLDEPTTGLDPAKREDMWDVVRRLVADGSTVLLTTQYLEEADALADEITVIDHGRVIAHDTPDGLKRVVGGQRIAGPPDRPRPARRRRGDPGRDRRRRRRSRPAAASSPCRSPARRRCRSTVARLDRRRHRRHRAVPAPAEPGRGLPHPDRPHAPTTDERGSRHEHARPPTTRRTPGRRPPTVRRRSRRPAPRRQLPRGTSSCWPSAA